MARTALELTESYRHYNGLIWQVPSWGIAIAAGVIVAANEVGSTGSEPWVLSVGAVRGMVLLLGGLLLFGLNAALARLRDYQAACHVHDNAHPLWSDMRFPKKPRANSVLQFVLCITMGILIGLAASELGAGGTGLVVGIALSAGEWWLLEAGRKDVLHGLEGM